MAAQEVIVLEVDPTSALKAQQATAKGFAETEARAKQATAAIAETAEQAGQQTIRLIDRSKNSIDRIAASAEKRASQIGRSALERLESQRTFDLNRVAGDPRAIERVAQAYSRLIAEQKKADAAAGGFGDRLRHALENPRGALDALIGGLTGLPGLIAAGATAAIGLGVGVFKVVSGMADWVEKLDQVAMQTGLTTEQVQLLTAAAKTQGVQADIITGIMRGLSKTMTESTADAIKLRKELAAMGVSGKDPFEVFLSIGEALSKIQDPFERFNKANEILGRSGGEALKLFNGQLRQTVEGIKEMGAALDENALAAMRRMDQRLDEAGVRWDTWLKKGKAAIVDLVDAWITQSDRLQSLAPVGGDPFSEVAKRLSPTELEERVRRDAATREQRDIAAGRAVVAEFERKRGQGLAGLQASQAALTQQRQDALGRVGRLGIGEAAARTAVADVQRLDKEIASVQARIKAIQEAPAKAEAERRQAEALDKALHGKRLEMIRQSEKEALDSAARQAEEMIALDGRVAQARTEYQRETGEMQDRIRQTNFDQQMVMLERSRDEQLRSLEAVTARTVSEKIALEQQKLEIELEYLKRAEELNLASVQRQNQSEIDQAYRLAQTKEDLENRLTILQQESAQRVAIARDDAEARIRATQQESVNRQAATMQTEYERAFDRIQNGFEGLFDALLTRSRSFGQALLGMLQAVLLTPLKQAMSATVAGVLTGRGGGALGGLFGGLPGLGGIGIPGAPGGTPGFAGPVGGLGSIGNAAGLLGLSGIGSLALGGGMLGGLGAFKLGQRGGIGGALAPGLGALSGMLGFGGLTAMFPALAAAGPFGLIAAGGIGAFAGILGLLRGKSTDKIREKIRGAYGIDIREKNILEQIAGITKQNFGGNIDMAISSQPIRELINLYSMAFGGRSMGLSNVARPVSVFQSGGQITQAPSAYSAAPPAGSRGMTVVMPVQVVGAREFLTQETTTVIARSGNVVQGAVLSAQRANVGRRKSATNMLAPNLITS